MLSERYNFLHFKPIKIAVSIHFQRVAMEERQRLVLGQKRKYTAFAEKQSINNRLKLTLLLPLIAN